MSHPVLGPHPFAGGFYYGESPQVRERRHAAVAPALWQSGFALERAPLDALAGLMPWPFAPASFTFALARGSVNGAATLVYEYGSVHGTASAPALQAHAVVVVEHPRLDGRAHVTVDAFPDKPPPGFFERARVAVFGEDPGPEDLVVGDPEFDRRYVVRAPSIEAARRAIPPSLSAWLVRNAFPGAVDIRPGLLLYALPGVLFEPARIAYLLAPLGPLVEAATAVARQGYR